MTDTSFADHLEQLDITQTEFGRLLQHLSSQTEDRGKINRWARSRSKPPSAVIAMCALLAMLPKRQMERLLQEAPPLVDRWPMQRWRRLARSRYAPGA